LKSKIKSLLYTGCFSLSPIKPSIELGRSVVAMLEENIFLKYLNLSSPPLRARLSFLVSGYNFRIGSKEFFMSF
jgi:hypothetical protein